MVRYLGPKNRIARRFGVNVFNEVRSPLQKRPNPPGMHGRRRKKSDYGLQLEEKQKLKACYGMLTERYLVNSFKRALSEEGNTVQRFMEKLECRLDTLVYRFNFAPTLFAAQQLVSHGHVLVNGKKVDCRSFLVKPGMELSIKPKSQKIPAVAFAFETASRALPTYLSLDKEKFVGKLEMMPALDQIEAVLPVPLNIAGICDFISHQN